jgi:hypothetical protein
VEDDYEGSGDGSGAGLEGGVSACGGFRHGSKFLLMIVFI